MFMKLCFYVNNFKVMFKFEAYINELRLWNAAKCYDAIITTSVSCIDIKFKWFLSYNKPIMNDISDTMSWQSSL